LNLYDQVEYELLVASDEQFNNVVLQVNQITDTTYSEQLQNGEYFWKVKAYTSSSTYTFSNVLSFVVDFPTDVNSENDTPSEFYLGQNYPNPFNPSTKIKFTIPSVETTRRVVFTTLKVYDLLGNEIETLVDDYKQPGTYEITFDVGTSRYLSLPSGVYYYQLSVKDPEINSGQTMVQTKKMILLK
jgi:hypothetical protein